VAVARKVATNLAAIIEAVRSQFTGDLKLYESSRLDVSRKAQLIAMPI
jgi:hypothetical protein